MAKGQIDVTGKSTAEALSLMQEGGEGGKKKKYLQFPKVSTFNAIVEVMKTAPETETLLKEFTGGRVKDKALNESAELLLEATNKGLEKAEKAKDEVKIKYFTAQKAKFEGQIKKPASNINLGFVLKFLLATNKNPAISELADDLSG